MAATSGEGSAPCTVHSGFFPVRSASGPQSPCTTATSPSSDALFSGRRQRASTPTRTWSTAFSFARRACASASACKSAVTSFVTAKRARPARTSSSVASTTGVPSGSSPRIDSVEKHTASSAWSSFTSRAFPSLHGKPFHARSFAASGPSADASHRTASARKRTRRLSVSSGRVSAASMRWRSASRSAVATRSRASDGSTATPGDTPSTCASATSGKGDGSCAMSSERPRTSTSTVATRWVPSTPASSVTPVAVPVARGAALAGSRPLWTGRARKARSAARRSSSGRASSAGSPTTRVSSSTACASAVTTSGSAGAAWTLPASTHRWPCAFTSRSSSASERRPADVRKSGASFTRCAGPSSASPASASRVHFARYSRQGCGIDAHARYLSTMAAASRPSWARTAASTALKASSRCAFSKRSSGESAGESTAARSCGSVDGTSAPSRRKPSRYSAMTRCCPARSAMPTSPVMPGVSSGMTTWHPVSAARSLGPSRRRRTSRSASSREVASSRRVGLSTFSMACSSSDSCSTGSPLSKGSGKRSIT